VLIEWKLIPAGEVDERSITEIKPHELTGYTQCHFFAGIGGWSLALELAGWSPSRPVWTGSCPCQPFSDAGQGKGIEDPRHLWPTWFRLIRECKPPKVLGEQVASTDGLAWFDHVSTDLESEAYAVGAADIPVAGVGAPQGRARLWFVANSNDPRREGAEWHGEPYQARQEWPPARGESLRSNCGPWPPGPREVSRIPVLAHGLPGVLGRCRGYGNAICPQVAAQFIRASE
jgi:DNA (cytosine-5)-methyltransferase 1